MNSKIYTLGFSNLCETIPFAVSVRQGLERAVARHPRLQLVIRDNDLNNDKALAHAQEFADLQVDLAIIFHIDERIGMNLRSILAKQRIPIIAVDIPIPMTVFLGIDNQQAGFLAGEALGQWIQTNWGSSVDKVLVMTEQRTLTTIRTRIESAIQGLASRISFDKNDIFYMDGGTHRIPAFERSGPVLKLWRDYRRIAVICSSDDAAMGVLDSAYTLGRAEDLAIIGQGATLAIDEFRKHGCRFIASTTDYPERYGLHLVDLALRMLSGEKVPSENLIQPVCVTIDNYQDWLDQTMNPENL